ncbi:hypothetical protein [Bradyrhizobium sp. STM 3562]|uniref:hypothetical protein n=1 Tax=Bradyrhizobium sp. STM 3562 TaxID=578924 RepID=UPI003890BE2D
MGNQKQIFVLEVDGRPTLAFEAAGADEAAEISRDADLRTDLCALTSVGVPICTATATLAPRPASRDEIAAFERAVHLAPASDEPTMAFLIQVDGVVVVSMDPE